MPVIDLRLIMPIEPVPDFVYKAMKPFVEGSDRYVHQPEELRHMLAVKHGVDPGAVQLVAGIDEAIFRFCAIYGRSTHVFTPTYVTYNDAKRFGHLTEHPSLGEDGYKIEPAPLDGASLIFLANPNNPAGLTSAEKIVSLVKSNPDAVVMVDEAFGDFGGQSVIPEVKNHPNLVVARSFSKGYGLAGMRIGYLIGPQQLIDELEFESTWFNVSYPAVGGAISALQHEAFFRTRRETLIAERATTILALTEHGYTVIRGATSVILLRFDTGAAALDFVAYLASANILVHQGGGASNIGLDDSFVRLAVGSAADMATFRTVISQRPA
jgi:histidinol-phosphate aminotransferase